MSGTTQYAPVTPVIAPVSGEPEQRLQQVADAITQNKIQVAQMQSDVKTINDKLATIGQGVTDGSDAAAGEIGEYVFAHVTRAAAAALTNATAVNLATITLTAGDWDVQGEAYFLASATGNACTFQGWINTASATAPEGTLGGLAVTSTTANGTDYSLAIPPMRLSLTAASTTVYLGASATFGTGSVTAAGLVRARRMR